MSNNIKPLWDWSRTALLTHTRGITDLKDEYFTSSLIFDTSHPQTFCVMPRRCFTLYYDARQLNIDVNIILINVNNKINKTSFRPLFFNTLFTNPLITAETRRREIKLTSILFNIIFALTHLNTGSGLGNHAA